MTLQELLARAQAQLQTAISERASAQATLLNLRSQDNLSESDVTSATALRDSATERVNNAQAEVERVQAEIQEEERINALSTQVRETAPRPPAGYDNQARITSEPEVYRQGGDVSYFRDLMRAQTRTGLGISEAGERLQRNSRQFVDQVRNAPREQTRALTTVDGAGGDFVPPLWLINEFIELARPGRVTADLVRQQALPPGTDTISLPRLATGTAVAQQATQNTAIQNTDATTNSVSAAVLTLAGGQSMAQQLLDQSPINMDEILLEDLAADYAVKADVFVIQNNATNAVGLISAAGVSVNVTATTLTGAGSIWAKLADGIQQIHTQRYMPPSAIVMHPRRWAWIISQVDTAGRPMVTPDAAFNPIANASGGVVSAGRVGVMQGLPVYTDPNLPTNLGAGTNQDPVLLMRERDVIFYESAPRAEASIQPGFNTLTVNLRFFRYVALHASRFPKSVAVLNGVGLVAPTF
jgi:HK97 family phage major capsid protein